MFDALIDPLQFVIVLLVIAIVVGAARWGARLAPRPADPARTDEHRDPPTSGDA